jgi:hypothetical protein
MGRIAGNAGEGSQSLGQSINTIRVSGFIFHGGKAMISLGIANSRMKDLNDIRILGCESPFDGFVLSEGANKSFTSR